MTMNEKPQEATTQPLVSNEQIYEWANSASNGNYQRSSIRRSLFKMRDSYEAELATLRAELAAATLEIIAYRNGLNLRTETDRARYKELTGHDVGEGER